MWKSVLTHVQKHWTWNGFRCVHSFECMIWECTSSSSHKSSSSLSLYGFWVQMRNCGSSMCAFHFICGRYRKRQCFGLVEISHFPSILISCFTYADRQANASVHHHFACSKALYLVDPSHRCHSKHIHNIQNHTNWDSIKSNAESEKILKLFNFTLIWIYEMIGWWCWASFNFVFVSYVHSFVTRCQLNEHLK